MSKHQHQTSHSKVIHTISSDDDLDMENISNNGQIQNGKKTHAVKNVSNNLKLRNEKELISAKNVSDNDNLDNEKAIHPAIIKGTERK